MSTEFSAVSIIIPCHNHRLFLWDCLQSIYAQQTSFDFEVIVVDDASTDHPAAVCQHFGARYARVEAKNANVARNHGLSLACGDVIVWFDADNIMLPGGLQALAQPILENRADVTYGQLVLIGNTERYPYTAYNSLPYTHEDLKIGGCIDTASAVWRPKIPAKPWDANITRTQDWDYHLTNFERGLTYFYIDQPIFKYRLHPLSKQRDYQNSESMEQNRRYIREKHGLESGSRATVTVALPSIGRYYSVTEWLNAVENLTYSSHKINLSILDQSEDEEFFRTKLLPFARRLKERFNAVHIRVRHHLKKIATVETLVEDNNSGRLENISNLMQYFSQNLTTPYLFVLEDDTSCPPDALEKLLAASRDPLVVAVTGIERSRFTKYSIGAWDFDHHNQPKNLYPVMRENGIREIGAGGFYCLLLKAKWCRQYSFLYPNRPQLARRDPDILLGFDIKRTGYRQLLDWSVACTHYSLLPDGRVLALKMDAFDEPDQYFMHPHLEPAAYVDSTAPAEPTTHNGPSMNFSLLIHSIQTVRQAEELLHHLPKISQTFLLPANDVAHERLANHDWPRGTILRPPANLARQLNHCLTHARYHVLILDAKSAIVQNLVPKLKLALVQSAVSSSRKSVYHPSITSWQPAPFTKWLTHYPNEDRRPVISLGCVAIKNSLKDELKLEPRLGSNIALLEWQLSRQLWQRGVVITTGPYVISESPLQITNAYDLGTFFSLEIPWRRLSSFLRHSGPTFDLSGAAKRAFFRGLLHDLKLKLTKQPRRQFLSPHEYQLR